MARVLLLANSNNQITSGTSVKSITPPIWTISGTSRIKLKSFSFYVLTGTEIKVSSKSVKLNRRFRLSKKCIFFFLSSAATAAAVSAFL